MKPAPHRIPLWLKLIYTAFVAVMVGTYWRSYGPQNFLYFCDVAVLVTLVGIWTENPLLISMEAVGILLPQVLWIVDFLAHVCRVPFMGMTDYMFESKYSLFLRGVSLFHGWMPVLLLWLVYRLGYDRRALRVQTVVGVIMLLICYFCFVPPGSAGAGGSEWREFNINYVYGFSDTAAQTRMPPLVWLGMLIVGIPVLLYLPAHRILSRVFKAGGVRDELLDVGTQGR